jgi:methylated-DNA-[protein]-cysteine S-methyltransferase
MTLHAARFPTPFGEMAAAVDDEGRLVRLALPGRDADAQLAADAARAKEPVAWDPERCAPVVSELQAYFRGERTAFDLPLAPRGTEFQRAVWTELVALRHGETTTYTELARRVGRPAAVRAVGRANATNPIPIVIPCHRVVGRDGTLTGYAGGLEMKAALLELESQPSPG